MSVIEAKTIKNEKKKVKVPDAKECKQTNKNSSWWEWKPRSLVF